MQHIQAFKSLHILLFLLALLKAQVPLQFSKVFSSNNEVSVSVMYSYMY